MSSLPLFDPLFSGTPEPKGPPLTGVELRDSGIQSVLSHTPDEYKERFIAAVKSFPVGRLITTEDIRERAGDPPDGVHYNAMGGLMRRAAGFKLIVRTSERRKAKRASLHASELVFVEEAMTSFQPSPISSFYDGVDSRNGNSVSIGQDLLRDRWRIVIGSNRPDIHLVKFRHAVSGASPSCHVRLLATKESLFTLGTFMNPMVLTTNPVYPFRVSLGPMPIACREQAGSDRMMSITFWGYVLQVVRAVIQLVAVPVVYLHPLGLLADERSSNQAMNGTLCRFRSIKQRNKEIMAVKDCGFEYAPGVGVRPFIPEGQSLNSPQVRHGVSALEADDGPPLFGFKFFSGKLWISQGVNLRHGFANWLGSFVCDNRRSSRLYFSTELGSWRRI